MTSPYFTRQQLKKATTTSNQAANALRALSKRRKPVCIEIEQTNQEIPAKKATTDECTVACQSNDGTHSRDDHPSPRTDGGVNWAPKDWRLVLESIKQMRVNRDAAVDTMGCERTHDPKATPEVQRFQILVSLMLSSQTKDQVTSAAVEKLKKHGLNIPNIIKTTEEDIEDLIHPVGFKKKKSKYVLEAAKICHEKFNGDIPDTVEGLVSLPGVGPKMAHICMNVAWNKLSGIGVDTHVHRIANRLRWVRKPTKQPEATRIELEKWLPREEWSDLNVLLVGFGQQTCLPIGPKCGSCLINQQCTVGRAIIRTVKDT